MKETADISSIKQRKMVFGMSAELMFGDCLELMQSIPDGSVDMVLCDLPYGVTANKWDTPLPLDKLWEQWHRVCKPTAAIVLHCMQPFTTRLIGSNMKEFRYCWVWDRHVCRNFLQARNRPLRQHEDIAVFYKKRCAYNPQMTKGEHVKITTKNPKSTCYRTSDKPRTYESDFRFPRSIISIPSVQNGKNVHPTEKPVPLLEYLIKTYTNPGETVLDNCMGSGSTGVAAMLTGRNFIGIEKDESYFNIAKERIEKCTGL